MHNANLYEVSNTLQRRDAVAILEEFVPKMGWSESELVLDVGCGAGDVTSQVLLPSIPSSLTKNPSIVGVDVSSNMVQHAKDRYAEKKISFAQMDIAKEIPARKLTRKFSKVFSFYCLHWVKDQAVALHNIHRLMGAESEAMLVFLAKNPIFNAYRTLAERPEWAPYMKDVASYVPYHQDCTDPTTSFTTQCDSMGFHVLHCESRSMEYEFDNVNQLVHLLKAVNPFLSRIPDDDDDGAKRVRFIRELVDELTTSTQQQKRVEDTGCIVARYSLLIAHLRKPKILPQFA